MSSDCEIAQYYVTKYRVAHKPHACCECRAKINVGEKYLQVNACWEGRPDVYRQHILCMEACEFVRDSDVNDSDCIYYGGLKEWYREWIKGGYAHNADNEDRKKLFRMMLGIYRRERKETPREKEK